MSKTFNDVIPRNHYINKLEAFIDTNLIKVFTGQRRTGKSYLLKSCILHVESKYPGSNIIYIDKEQYEFESIRDEQTLISFVNKMLDENKKNFLFIDEIQEISSFEKALRHFQNKPGLDIYCTGSNAQMLSGDLAGLLSGRFIQVKVNTLSYREFLDFHSLEDSDESLQKYMKWGGLPFLKNLPANDEVIYDYLGNIISTILYKDIIHRYKIRNVDFFDSLIRFIASNTGNLITAKSISNYLRSQQIDISTKVVINYLEYLQNAFLAYKIKRFDIHGKKLFEIINKYFFEDWGLRNALLGLHSFSVPDILENIVFSHLKYLGYSVNIGVLKDIEIDFIAEKSGQKIYIQVAYLIADEKVKEREFGNLLKIKDNYPKFVISLDQYVIGEFEGVKHLHLRTFLMMENFDLQ